MHKSQIRLNLDNEVIEYLKSQRRSNEKLGEIASRLLTQLREQTKNDQVQTV